LQPCIPIAILSTMNENDQLFMEKLYHDYHRLMFYHAWRYFQDQDQVEDVVQQACLKLIKYLPTIKQLNCNVLASYIVTVIKSVAIDHFRKQKTERVYSFSDYEEGFEERLPDEQDLEDMAHVSITSDQLAQAILSLSEKDQFVLNTKYLLCWSDDEIAMALGIKKVTVRTRLFRAKRRALLALSRGKDEDQKN